MTTLNFFDYLPPDPFDEPRSDEMIVDLDAAQDTWRKDGACSQEYIWKDGRWHYIPARRMTDLFFPETYRSNEIEEARKVCTTCPVFDQCKEWGFREVKNLPEGIFFGYGPNERLLMAEGTVEFVDWRFVKTISKQRMAALEREARKRGVPVVVNAQHIYEIDDPEEKRRIIADYRRWQEEQAYRCSEEDTIKAVERLANAYEDKGNTRAKALPPELRPRCEHGHDPQYMERIRKTASGHPQWKCRFNGCGFIAAASWKVGDEPGKRRLNPTVRPACPNGHRPEDMRRDNREQQFTCYICKAKVPFTSLVGAA